MASSPACVDLRHRTSPGTRIDIVYAPAANWAEWVLETHIRLDRYARGLQPITLMLIRSGGRERAKGHPVFLIRRALRVVEALARNLQERFPPLVIAGCRTAHAFRSLTEVERAATIDPIRNIYGPLGRTFDAAARNPPRRSAARWLSPGTAGRRGAGDGDRSRSYCYIEIASRHHV